MPSLYHQLLEEILQGDIEPGTPLVESVVGERFGVSRTPVREALRMLEQDGMLERANRGLQVRQTSPEEVLEIYSVRGLLEGAAAAGAAERHTDYDLATLERLLDTMSRAEGASPQELATINRSFHRAIWQAARNRTLIDLLERLAVHLRRYPATTYETPGRWQTALDEHRALYEAIRAGKAKLAASVAEQHMGAARNARLDMIRGGGSPPLATLKSSIGEPLADVKRTRKAGSATGS
ncbi:MAG: GntR family transcriptional regulator [Acidimicrobiales bacterium]